MPNSTTSSAPYREEFLQKFTIEEYEHYESKKIIRRMRSVDSQEVLQFIADIISDLELAKKAEIYELDRAHRKEMSELEQSARDEMQSMR